jgi:hypothetical protein
MLMISDNVEFLPPIFMPCFGSYFENGRHLENFENAELLLVHASRKERIRIIIIKIIIRNGAKTTSLQTLFGRLNNNYNKKRSKNNKSPNVVWET